MPQYSSSLLRFQNGASFLFTPELVQGLADASPDDLAQVELIPSGEGLHWETLDVEFKN
ncbi:MAG: DUF2442 domain-containing protein [Coleofasciculus sp. B1-GNL1-01]|uniref:DUF2442 domain-containing protein n=1 Tax=Coleofasciculus sp. B1-GNL1-01 TaxID=3068484 RepID=UPI0032F64ED2